MSVTVRLITNLLTMERGQVREEPAGRLVLQTCPPELSGRALDTDPALRTLRRQADRLRFEPIDIRDREMKPTVVTADDGVVVSITRG